MTATATTIEPVKRKRILIRAGLLIVPFGLLGLALALWAAGNWRPTNQSDRYTHTVYAYRQWQSTDFYLNVGDQVFIKAQGEWSYSPEVGLNGPEGAAPAPDYYPLRTAPGGALLGRIGEDGPVFYVGKDQQMTTSSAGMLYLAINDDLLGDNKGQLNLMITVVSPTATANP